MSTQELDHLTRMLFIREQCEDPFCCNILRHEIVNEIREFFGLAKLDSRKDDFDLPARP